MLLSASIVMKMTSHVLRTQASPLIQSASRSTASQGQAESIVVLRYGVPVGGPELFRCSRSATRGDETLIRPVGESSGVETSPTGLSGQAGSSKEPASALFSVALELVR